MTVDYSKKWKYTFDKITILPSCYSRPKRDYINKMQVRIQGEAHGTVPSIFSQIILVKLSFQLR